MGEGEVEVTEVDEEEGVVEDEGADVGERHEENGCLDLASKARREGGRVVLCKTSDFVRPSSWAGVIYRCWKWRSFVVATVSISFSQQTPSSHGHVSPLDLHAPILLPFLIRG